jgi:hypothetical protein
MSYQIAMRVAVRRAADAEALAAEIEADFRAATVGDRDLDQCAWAAKKRGGEIVLRALVADDSRETVMDRIREIARSIETNANRIDRVDSFQIAAFLGHSIVGFSAGEFKGWQREYALEELGHA